MVQTINGRHKRLLYNEFQWNCTYPFWEFNSNSNIINTENANTDVSINDNVINNNIVNNNNDDNDIENILPEELWPKIQKLIHFTEKYETHNYRHVIALLDGSKRVRNMMDDISHVQNKRVRNRIYKGLNPRTMYKC